MSLKDTDVKTPGDSTIAKKFKLSLSKVRKLVDVGAKHEKEHNTNLAKAKQVARDHIGERPDYYSMLSKAEKTDKNKLKEGISAGPERESDYSIGDATGGRRTAKVDEGAKIQKAKKLAAAGLTAANLYTLGDVTSRAVEGNRTVSAKHDVVKAASALPGPAGYAAAAINYAKQAYDKVKQMKEENDLKGACWKGYTAKGLKKKGGKMVPNCIPVSEQGSPANPARYTERPTYEMKAPDNKLSSGEVARGIYEGRPATRQKPEIVKHNDKDVGKVWSHSDGSFSSVRKKGHYKVSMRHKTKDDAIQHLKDKSVEMTEGYASIGHSFDWAGDVNRKAKFYGKKPKATTTKGDEKDDTYKDSKQGGKVKFAKTVKEEKKPKAVKLSPKQEQDKKIPNSLASYRDRIYQARLKQLRKEDIADKDWDDTSMKKLPEEETKKDVRLMGNQKPDAWGYGAKGKTHTIHEETKMDTKEHINEALDNILDNNLVEMKENLLAALQEKAMEKLEEKKKDIAANYFAQ